MLQEVLNGNIYHKIDLELVQSSGNIDIVQSSGTCPTGVSSCHSELIADFDSENATITINQKDTGITDAVCMAID